MASWAWQRLALMVALGSMAILPRASSGGGSIVLDSVPLIDGHNAMPSSIRRVYRNYLSAFDIERNMTSDPNWQKCGMCSTNLQRLRAGKVKAQVLSIWPPCRTQYNDAVAWVLEQIDMLENLLKPIQDFAFAKSSHEIIRNFRGGKSSWLMGLNGGHGIDSRMAVLRIFYRLGIRMMALTHNCHTPWAESYGGKRKAKRGLTEFGRRVVREMNRLGMLIDLSHSSVATQLDVFNVSQAPVVFSHAGAAAICDHPRNVPDHILNEVYKNNGIVMVYFYNWCNKRDGGIGDVVDHINYIRGRIGVNHVGIGSTFDSIQKSPTGLENPSKIPDLFDRLAEGDPKWSPDELKRLAAGNFIRVMNGVEKVRDEMARTRVTPDEEWIPDMERIDATCFTPTN